MKARPFSFVSHYDAAWVVLVALTFMLALVIVPVAADSFVMPKETLVAVGCVLGAALVAGWTLLGNGKLSLALKPLNGAVLVWVLWHWLSVIWADARVMAVESATRTSLYVGIFFLLQLVAGGYRSRMAWLLGAVAGSSLVLSIWTVFQDARAAWFPGSVPVRAVLGDWRDALSQVGLGNTSHLGDALVLGFLCWVAALLVVRRGWVRWAVVASLALHAAALIVTWSVHSNVSLVLAGGLLVFLLWGARPLVGLVRGRRLWLGALVGCWAAVVLFFTVDHPLNPHGSAVWAQEDSQRGGIFSQAFSSSRWTSGLDTRKAIWLTTLEIVRLNPWLGTGAGTFTWVYPATISELVRNDAKLASWSGSWTNAAHQEVLQVWSELGIVGAALLVVLVAISLRSSWERLRGGASGTTAVMLAVGMAGLVAICLQSQMNFPLRMPVGTFHFYLFLAVPLLLPRSEGESWDLDVPVERPYGPINVGIMMRNMAYPTEVSLRLSFERPASVGLAVLVAVVAVAAMLPATAPFRSDLAYREVREGKLRMRPGVDDPKKLVSAADRVLAIWPAHVDCRSARQDLLLQAGDFEAVVAETPIVLEKLNAVEVYVRRAVALEGLGRAADAQRDWREVVRRRPDLAAQFEGAAAALALKQPPTSQP